MLFPFVVLEVFALAVTAIHWQDAHQNVPTVDRSILSRLAFLDDGDDPRQRLYDKLHPSENTATDALQTSDLEYVNHQICNAASCRFLLPLRIAEQESKARIHLLQILQLAQQLNRTLVLPNVGHSRLGACSKWDFGTYYDVYGLGAEFNASMTSVVRMDPFMRWLSASPTFPSGQMASFPNKPVHHSTPFSFGNLVVHVEHDRHPHDSSLTRCLSTTFRRVNLDAFSSLLVCNKPEQRKAMPVGDLIVQGLLDPEVQAAALRSVPLHGQGAAARQPDVLVVDWDLRQPVFSSPSTLAYSPQLIELATMLAPAEPYVAVHWRMETVPLEALPSCSAALIDSLSSILLSYPSAPQMKTVWLATDYPFPIGHSDSWTYPGGSRVRVNKSGTFKQITAEHKEAIAVLEKAFETGRLARWNLLDVSGALWRLREGGDVIVDEDLVEDAGVLGILDKIVSMRANVFLSGANGCGRASSYTRQIIEARQKQTGESRNVAEFFG